jgi:hypothetical protein
MARGVAQGTGVQAPIPQTHTHTQRNLSSNLQKLMTAFLENLNSDIEFISYTLIPRESIN